MHARPMIFCCWIFSLHSLGCFDKKTEICLCWTFHLANCWVWHQSAMHDCIDDPVWYFTMYIQNFSRNCFFVRHMYSVFYDHVKLLALYSDVSKQNNIYHYHSLLWFCWDHSPLFDVIWIFATRPCRWRHYVFVCLSTMFVRTDIVTTILHERLRQSRWNLQGITINPYWWPGWILEVKVTAGCRGGEGMHVDAGKLKSFYFVIAQVPKTNFCTKAHHKKLLCLK